MKNKNKLIGLLTALVMCITYLIPITTIPLKAGTLVITDISQGSSDLYAGDNFTLTVQVASEDSASSEGNPNISVFGSAVDTENMTYDINYWSPDGNREPVDEDGKPIKTPEEIIIKGLKYTGQGKEITVNIEGDFRVFKLNATTLDEGREFLKVDDSVNLLVKTDATQNAQVKVVNQGKQTLKKVRVNLELAEEVEGIKIKTEEAIISQIQAKEIKTAAFSIEVDKEVKAKVYKATATVNGVSFPVNLQVDSNIMPSVLEVSTDESKVFKPGVAQDTTIKVKNVGERAAKNIKVELNSEMVSIAGGSNVKYIQAINAKAAADLVMRLKVNSDVTKGTVPIKIDLTYLNSLGEETKDSQTVYLTTSETAVSSEVVIDNIVSPAATFGVNENFDIKFDVSAKGGAENLKISVKGDEGIVPKSQNLFFLPKLQTGERKQYNVTFSATRAAVSSSHYIEVTVEYGGGEKPITISQYGSINITNPEKDAEDNEDDKENKKGTPKVIIGEYVIDPVIVKAGQEFNLSLGFLNTNKIQAVHNFKANIKVIEQGENGAGNVFTPVGASNTFFISDLMPEQTITKNITLYTIPSAQPKTYEVTLEMEYEDDKGNEVKATENIGIPVEQVTQIEIGDIQVDPGQVGAPAYFNAILYNTGKTDISNVMIHIEGEGFSVQENKMFIGNFEKGMTESYGPTLIPEMAGTLTGNIFIDYEDTTGETKQIIKEFNIEVAEMMMDNPGQMDGEEMMPEQPKAKWPLLVGIGVGIVAAIIVTAVVLKKRKAKKEKMMLDEDD